MATEGTFNPNGYTREQIALALRRGYESDSRFTQVQALITEQASKIAGIESDISDLQQMATLEERLLTPISWDSNILSISQEDISIDGASGDTAYLSTDGTVHVTKSSTTRKMTVDFSRVYIPRSIGATMSYNFGVFGIPDEDVVCILCSSRADGNETSGLQNLVECSAVYHKILDNGESTASPRLNGNSCTGFEVTHEQLAGCNLVVRTVCTAVYIQ